MNDTIEKLSRCIPTLMDGVEWYPWQEILAALKITGVSRPGKHVSAENKRLVRRSTSGYRVVITNYVNRAGVEQLVIEYGRSTPRAAAMAALPHAWS